MKWKRGDGIEHWTFTEDGKMENKMIKGGTILSLEKFYGEGEVVQGWG